MSRELFHIYGPISVNSFGVMIAVGILIFCFLILKNPRRAAVFSTDQFIDMLFVGILTGIIASRLLAVITDPESIDHWTDIFKFWEGGYSVLGAIIGNLLALPWYLRKRNIPVLPSLDLIALHMPLLQSIAKFGCFFAGCCYGKPTTLPWGVTYTEAGGVAPINVCIHPTQIYSSFILLLIFAFLYFVMQNRVTKAGQIFALYLILEGLERFAVDFLRDDQEFFSSSSLGIISIYQWIALGIALSGCVLLYTVSTARTTANPPS